MMQEVIPIPVDAVIPTIESILTAQGVPASVTPNDRTIQLAERSASLYRTLARPTGIFREVPLDRFLDLLAGEGLNADATPVEATARKANSLALFAITAGAELTYEIANLFKRQDFALAAMLDSQASEGAELAAAHIEKQYVEKLEGTGRFDSESGVIRYSPGYCGWHVSGQRRLFKHLRPEAIGLTLRESCLMDPLKSISGVIISGERAIFDFETSFDFCDDCSTWSCRERVSAAMGG